MRLRNRLAVGIALVFFAVAAVYADFTGDEVAHATNGDADGPADTPDAPLITPEIRKSIDSGLKYLASRQAASGAFSSGHYRDNPGITGLACVAFMSGGSQPGRGPYGEQIERGLDFVLKSQDKSGVLATQGHAMYAHGFATMFLGEVAGMSRRDDVDEALRKAVSVIRQSQSVHGGWRYTPFVRTDADLSVTICVLTGLRAAANAGVTVERSVVGHAIQYVKSCATPDGGFSYTAYSGGGTYAMNAAGVAALYFAGQYEAQELKKGVRRLKGLRHDNRYFYYALFYAAQAMYLCGEVEGREVWRDWYRETAALLQRKQNAAGYWSDNEGAELNTAFALIVLQIPNSYLPIFER